MFRCTAELFYIFLCRFANSLPINDPLQTVYQLMSGRMPASATVCTACVFASIPSCCVFALAQDESLCCLSSAVERRSGATGALTWPWFCPISRTAKTWILAPSAPWVTHLVCTSPLYRKAHPTFRAVSQQLFCFVAASKGLIDAAHFCYLMAQVGLGVYTKKSTKMVLIGSNHRSDTEPQAATLFDRRASPV